MKMFLHTSKYEINVKYIQGNPLNEIDLEKAGITKAKVIIILTDKYSLNMQIDYDNSIYHVMHRCQEETTVRHTSSR